MFGLEGLFDGGLVVLAVVRLFGVEGGGLGFEVAADLLREGEVVVRLALGFGADGVEGVAQFAVC